MNVQIPHPCCGRGTRERRKPSLRNISQVKRKSTDFALLLKFINASTPVTTKAAFTILLAAPWSQSALSCCALWEM